MVAVLFNKIAWYSVLFIVVLNLSLSPLRPSARDGAGVRGSEDLRTGDGLRLPRDGQGHDRERDTAGKDQGGAGLAG